jgi:hypothetical protein
MEERPYARLATPREKSGLRYHVLAIALAAAGGAFGVLGAIVQELRAGGFLLLAFAGAPIIEELMKPSGVYVVLWRWPAVLRSRLYTASLCALGGLVFGLIEAAAYLSIYAPDHTHRFFIYRMTVPLALHATTSFIVGLGLNRGLIDWAEGRAPLSKWTRNCLVTAMLMHAAFNITVFSLDVAGVVKFY